MADEDIAAAKHRRRRRFALVAMGAGGVGAGLALGAVLMRPKPCDALARELCAGDTTTECQQLGAKLVEIGVSQSDCAQARRTIESAPPSMRDSVRTSAVMGLLQGHVDPTRRLQMQQDARKPADARE